MLILAVDTSTRMGSAAILRDCQVLAEVSGYEETPYSARLFRDIATLQSQVQFSLSQVDVFAVTAGPGSFTGLRVGLTAVKAWAEVHRKPIAAVSGLEAIATMSLAANEGSGLLAPFLDARRGQLYGAVYRRASRAGIGLERANEEAVLSPGEFLETIKTIREKSSVSPLLVSPTPAVLPSLLVKEVLKDARVEPVPAALAPAIGRLGYEMALRGDLIDPIRLDANYVRRSDAEAAWKDG
jgi:tRNA threonylcarbamoyladenosine biosynthesis protein TsaB